MRLKTALVSATAIALVMGAAWADSNVVYLHQSGDSNSAVITQSGEHNQAGAATVVPNRTMTQSGNNNTIDVLQENKSRLGFSGEGVDQIGDRNVLTVQQVDGTATYSGQNMGMIDQVQQTSTGATSTATHTTNEAVVDQRAGANRVTLIEQIYTGSGGAGERNLVTITQIATHPNGNSILNARQVGSANQATITQDGLNNSVGHTPSTTGVNQFGVGNTVAVTQTGGSNWVNDVVQTGGGNAATVYQGTNRNHLYLLSQTGDGNAATVSLSGSYNGNRDQINYSNVPFVAFVATNSVVEQGRVIQFGDDNFANILITGTHNLYGLRQQGDDNSASAIVDGNSNDFAIHQLGDGNTAELLMGNLTPTGTGNAAVINQFGNDNAATGTVNGNTNNLVVAQAGDDNTSTSTIAGNSNFLSVSQTGNSNTVTANISGNLNGGGTFTGHAATLATARSLTSGQIVQDGPLGSGDFNNATLTITGSNSNQFAMLQRGNSNTISHTITGGASNQAVIAQVGNGNASVTTQAGSFNNVAVSQ